MKLIDFSQYKTEKELKEFCQQLYSTNLVLQNKISNLEEKLEHAEKLVVTPKVVATEDDLYQLLLREIAYIDNLSKQGGLNSEESKQLKILVDSYVSLRRQNAEKEPKKAKRLPNDPAKLIALVKGSEQ